MSFSLFDLTDLLSQFTQFAVRALFRDMIFVKLPAYFIIMCMLNIAVCVCCYCLSALYFT